MMSLKFIALLCVISTSTNAIPSDEPVSAPPKFGDRIGKLKRNFLLSTSTSTTTSTTTTTMSSLDDENDIHRSDDYFTTEDHENKNFIMLKGGSKDESYEENQIERHERRDILDQPTRDDQNSSLSLNKTFQIQSPSSSLVQARLEMLTDFFDVPPSPMPSVYSTQRPSKFVKTGGVVLASKNHHVQPTTNTTFRSQLIAVETGLRREAWVIPVIVLACVSMFMMAAFEIFVLCKTRKTSPNRRHLFLGQMLLLGLFTCASTLR